MGIALRKTWVRRPGFIWLRCVCTSGWVSYGYKQGLQLYYCRGRDLGKRLGLREIGTVNTQTSPGGCEASMSKR